MSNDARLVEVHNLLIDFPNEQQALARALDLAARITETAAAAPTLTTEETTTARTALARLAEIAAPPPDLFYDDPDLEEADLPPPQLRQDFLHRIPAAQRLAASLIGLLSSATDPSSRPELELRARLLVVFGRYDASTPGLGIPLASAADDLLPTLLGHPPSVRLPLARHVLTVSLPPYFKLHPKLNPATGRVLSRPLGGEGALNTWFESSEQDVTSWRRQVGLAAVVNLVIEALQPGEIEDLWPFLLPPLLSYLDDFESANKMRGVAILGTLLKRVDASLLRRTGVGKVFERSLEACFSALSDPNTPRLLAATHPIALQLVNLQYPPPRPSDPLAADEPRFEALCRLFTTSIVHAWEFKGQNVAIETVTACALAPLVDAMGSATIRYLQILMPHLTDLLVTTATAGGDGTWTVDTATMMLAASRALVAVVRNARLRMRRWEGKIGVAVSQCWIGMHESKTAQALQAGSQEGSAAIEELKESLADLLRELEGVSDTPIATRLAPYAGLADLVSSLEIAAH
ncbi:hypothetical protein C6P46_000435 [Rhodotorula mucilaginosa]|uniref:Uncharacterized protein n=1 Tax=Rhodotorula mucilaginosa TaxID=5537 RepID=A0A9P6VVI8_RHOMI|nr:hypothetical protein C6P46_000435 [Rhodotorula mucilaginosa]TKA54258.1 hypothetical protein B0A53_03349 [Rhodotorula sp. CCFEE 5036]